MKKFWMLGVMALSMTACSVEGFYDEEIVEKGQISLSMSTNDDVVVSTRDIKELNATEAANYLITIKQGDNAVAGYNQKMYSEIAWSTLFFPVNTYQILAESCTEEDAEDGNGRLRYYGASEKIKITANNTTAFDVTCTMANAMVSIAFDNSFTNAFQEGYSVALHRSSKNSRTVTFNASETGPAFFNCPADETLVGTITATINGSETPKTFNISGIALEAAHHYILTIGASSDNGSLSLTIKVDDTCTEESKTITIDPYNGTVTTA